MFFLEQGSEIPVHINCVKLYICVFQFALFYLYCLIPLLTVNVIKQNEDIKTTNNSLRNTVYLDIFSRNILSGDGGGANCRPLKVPAEVCMPRYIKEKEII